MIKDGSWLAEELLWVQPAGCQAGDCLGHGGWVNGCFPVRLPAWLAGPFCALPQAVTKMEGTYREHCPCPFCCTNPTASLRGNTVDSPRPPEELHSYRIQPSQTLNRSCRCSAPARWLLSHAEAHCVPLTSLAPVTATPSQGPCLIYVPH